LLITLSPLAEADPQAVDTLLDAAFGPDRRGRTAYKLRDGMFPIPDLSLAAHEDDRLIGSLQCWPPSLRNECQGLGMIKGSHFGLTHVMRAP